MVILQITLWKGRYHSQQTRQRAARQATGERRGQHASEARRRVGHEALDAGGEPDDTGMPDALLRRDPQKRQGQAVEGMGRIDDLDRLIGQNSQL
jgi:hypothetical protein